MIKQMNKTPLFWTMLTMQKPKRRVLLCFTKEYKEDFNTFAQELKSKIDFLERDITVVGRQEIIR